MELPGASRFAEAKLNDPQVAMIIAKAEREAEHKGEKSRWTPKYSEWDLHAQMLKEVREAVYSTRDHIVSALGQRPKRVAVLPNPVTEVDHARQRLEQQAQNEIIFLFAPHAVRR